MMFGSTYEHNKGDIKFM
jgi:hypothetical protein